MEFDLSPEELEFAEFYLKNKTLSDTEIDIIFGQQEASLLRQRTRKYRLKQKYIKEQQKIENEAPRAQLFDPEVKAKAKACILEILDNPDNPNYFRAVAMAYSDDKAYVDSFNKALAEKDVAEGNKARFVPRIIENKPDGTSNA